METTKSRNGLAIFLSVAIVAMALTASAQSEELTFATEKGSSFPWTLEKGGGVDTILLQMVAKNLGHTIKVVRVPWKRCLKEMEQNEVDGCYSASFKEARKKHGVYPMSSGTHDVSKKLHPGSYSLFTLNNTTLNWDGDKFINLTGKVGAPAGYSIIDILKAKGATVYESATTENLFKMLIAGRISGVAALTPQGDQLMKNNEEFSSQIKKIEKPLVEKPYYLMFSHKRSKNSPELVKAFYDEIEKVRNSQAYSDMYNSVLSK